MEHQQVSEFGTVLLYLIGGIVFVVGGLVTAWLVRPNRPNAVKLTTYECGEEPAGSAWGRFNIRFYIVALVFLLFDVEIVFLFPWATVFGNETLINATGGLWGWFSLVEMVIFIGILGLGLAYVWAKGLLDWVKPAPQTPDYAGEVPQQLYAQLNEQYASSKAPAPQVPVATE